MDAASGRVGVTWDAALREVTFPEGHRARRGHRQAPLLQEVGTRASSQSLSFPSCLWAQLVTAGGTAPPPRLAPPPRRPSAGWPCPGSRRPGGGVSYLLASEITLLVASASCWHLIFSAVAFSNADVRLLRLALSSWEEEQEGRSSPGRERPSAGCGRGQVFACGHVPSRVARTHGDLVLDPGQLLLCLRQLGVGLLQGLPLGGHVAVDLVEADDVDAPGAQARGGRGLGADELGVEGRVALVGPGEGTGRWWGPRRTP